MCWSHCWSFWASLFPLLPPAGKGQSESIARPSAIVVAGLLIGAAVGLKLTVVIFGIGAIAAVLVGRYAVRNIVFLGVGGVIGLVVSGGWWAFRLWHSFGSPLFPFYNAWFKAPDGPQGNLQDLRFLPHNVAEALAIRVLWALGDHRTARDDRGHRR